MGHTPGPWEWLEDKFNGGYSGLVAPRTGEEVLFPNHRNEGDDGDAWFEDFPNEANAHLIAAAPELLEAAESAMRYDKAIRSCANDPDRMASYCTAEGEGLDTLYCDWMVKSFKALKKARGE